MLLRYVEPINHFSIFGQNKVIVKDEWLSGKGVYTIFEHVKWMEKQKISIKTTIEIQSKAFQSSDVINVLELLMLYLAKKFTNLFILQFSKMKTLNKNILFLNSLLAHFDKKILNSSYVDAFYKTIYTPTHYRKIVRKKDVVGNYLCAISDDIKNIIMHGGADEKLAFDSVESMTEMVGNVAEHSDGDCIVDVKICKNIEGKLYLCLNVISLTNIFIGDRIMELATNDKTSDSFSGNKIVKRAYNFHSNYFDNSYDASSFYFACSFQNSVSTRDNIKNSGGTGFTTLLRNINNKSFNQEYRSYILSGQNTIYFQNDYLKVDDNGIIGFNDNNDFFTNLPNNNILKKELITFPGTIFCVNLITEEKIYETN